MKTIIRIALLIAALAAAGCSLPEAKGPGRVCIPDSAICYFPDDPAAPDRGPRAR
ncbi:MAG: hypothetical protein ACT4P3_21975 [Betaproteobacteria bacterium]